MQIEAKLKEMGIELPPAVTPVANYVPAVRTGNLVFLSGHGPFKEDGSLITGKVGVDLTVEQGYQAARRDRHRPAGFFESRQSAIWIGSNR